MSVKENLAAIRSQIADACRAVGRKPEQVNLLAVSKKQPLQKVIDAYQAGQREFGENYVQELVERQKNLPPELFPGIKWHLIGPLQRNKVKFVAGQIEWIHTVDRTDLVEALAKQTQNKQKILIQVRLGDEETKHGAQIEDVPGLIQQVRAHAHLRLGGLMTLPPLTEDPNDARIFFKQLRELRDQWSKLVPSECGNLDILSMGTSHDFQVAIAEGATLVRVGTSIFGERGS